MRQLKYAALILVLIVAAGGFYYLRHSHKLTPKAAQTAPTKQVSASSNNQADGFNKSQYPLTDPTSLWVIVNKQHPLNPASYAPADLTVPNVPLRVPGNETMQLRQVTATALETMFVAAKADGINLMLSSGYRSYSYQVSLYNSYVKSSGQTGADTYSARPGYSEHQTGLAADIEGTDRTCEVNQCWGDTPEGKWLAANAYKYGFIIRYTADNQALTGYEPEPWHIRYVGTALSQEMHKDHIDTLEQFFGVSGGQTYKS